MLILRGYFHLTELICLTAQNMELDELLSEPRESLDVELKEWLDLNDHDHSAMVAKEVIALANHGGGYLIVGFEQQGDGTFTPAGGRPPNLEGWSQDRVQSVVAKYIDPLLQCRVVHRTRPTTTDLYPIVAVPGGHRLPIRAKRGSPDGRKLVPHRVYIRRAGPASEEPQTAEEWDRLLERCLQNRRADLLEAMRAILAGIIPTAHQQTPSRAQELLGFEGVAIGRWEAKVASLPADASPRFPNGHYDFGAAIEGSFEEKSLSDLRRIIANEVRNHSGWPPFVTLNRAPFAPRPVDGAVEFWRGPDTDGSYNEPADSDFWRISPKGLMFIRRGYQEDGGHYGMEPGTFLDISAPTRRLGEAILEASYIAKALSAEEANLICHGRWVGLSGRRLISRGNPSRYLVDQYECAQDTYEATATVGLDALPDALPELVFAILAPLYELFDFFRLPKRLVEEELADLQRNTF